MLWYADWFQEDYDILYAHRNDEQAIVQVDLILKTLSLDANAKILDLGCGKGRHTHHLQKTHLHTIGADLSGYLLLKAHNKGCNNLARADFNFLPFKEQSFDVVCSFFTSFGYVEPRAQNLAILKNALQLVKHGGFFFLDIFNILEVKKTLPFSDTVSREDRTYHQHRTLAPELQVCKEIIIQKPNTPDQTYYEKVFGFELKELWPIFENNDFELIALWGSESGEDFTPSSPRLSILAQRKPQ